MCTVMWIYMYIYIYIYTRAPLRIFYPALGTTRKERSWSPEQNCTVYSNTVSHCAVSFKCKLKAGEARNLSQHNWEREARSEDLYCRNRATDALHTYAPTRGRPSVELRHHIACKQLSCHDAHSRY